MSLHFFRFLLVCCLANCLPLFSFAQSGLLSESELDTIKVWYNARTSSQADFINYSGFYQYETFSELAGHIKAGKRIYSITTNGIARDVENLGKCQGLQSVRIMLIPGREGYLDSVLTNLKGLPIQHLDIGYVQTFSQAAGLTKHDKTASVKPLPASVRQLGFLKKITLNAQTTDWQQAVGVLSEMPTLKTVGLTPLFGYNKPENRTVLVAGLSKLTQIEKLILLLSDEMLITAELAQLVQLKALIIQDKGSAIDEPVRQLGAAIAQMTNLETLEASMRVLNKGEALANLKKLKKLKIRGFNTGDKLTNETPINLNGLKDLEELSIDGANLSTWPDGICTMPRLKLLSLRSNKLSGVPVCLGNLKQLETLVLQNNMLTQSLAPIGGLGKLQTLNLSSCQLDTLVDFFGTLPDLKNLYLEQNQLKTLPNSIGLLTGLLSLHVSGNQLSRLPPLMKVTKLIQLNAGRNKLTEIPPSISRAVSLTSLMAGGNELVQLPEGLADCKNIVSLDLSFNKLTQLPARLGNLKRLKRLNLNSNAIPILPESITQLDLLVRLDISRNRIAKLPASVNRWKNLQEFLVHQNPIRELPEDIGSLTRLTSLHLEDNPVQTLPASVGNLTELRHITLTKSNVRFLPEEIGKLKKLRGLMLIDNELMALPDQLGDCPELETIMLIGNKLTGLPNSIGRLNKLKRLTIQGGENSLLPIESLPDSIVRCATLEYVNLMNLPALNANEAFKQLILLPNLHALSIINTRLGEWPEIDWSQVHVKQLDLDNNTISTVPVSLLNAPNLNAISLRGNPLPQLLDAGFTSKDQLRIALAETGQIKLNVSGKKDWPLANGFMQSSMRKASQRDWAGAEADMAKAIELAPDSVIAVIHAQRAEFYFFRKQFGDAVTEFDKALNKLPLLTQNSNTLKLSEMRVPPYHKLNPLWLSRKAMALGRMGQFEAARTAAEFAAKAFPEKEKINPVDALTAGMIFTELGRFQLLTNQRSQAIFTFKNAISAYEKHIMLDAGTRLTMVELCLITGQYDRSITFLDALPDYQRSGGYALLHEYLRLATAVLAGKQTPGKAGETLDLFIKTKGGQITGWSYDLFDTWLTGAGLPEEKAGVLNALTSLVKIRSVISE